MCWIHWDWPDFCFIRCLVIRFRRSIVHIIIHLHWNICRIVLLDCWMERRLTLLWNIAQSILLFLFTIVVQLLSQFLCYTHNYLILAIRFGNLLLNLFNFFQSYPKLLMLLILNWCFHIFFMCFNVSWYIWIWNF